MANALDPPIDISDPRPPSRLGRAELHRAIPPHAITARASLVTWKAAQYASPVFGLGRVKREAVAALAVLEAYEANLNSGRLRVVIERGATAPGRAAPTMYRGVLWSDATGQVGQLMFSWYDNIEPDRDFVVQQISSQFLGMAVGIRDGISPGGSLRFKHYPHQPKDVAMLEMDMDMEPPDLLQLQLVAPQP
jgi:hypothetical protein